MYREILDLREIADGQRRGMAFEQSLREILPWSARPPLSTIGQAEQFDAFFEWNSWHFIVEAKAKRDPIRRGSPDWEDFELKMRKRRGSCIGLFCSLFPVAQQVIEAARDLNKESICTLVLHGEVWDELAEENLDLEIVIRYLVLKARSSFAAVPPRITDIRTWYFDRTQTARRVYSLCRAKSTRFLRRHKLPKHADLYVNRDVDRHLLAVASELAPSKLMRLVKEKRTHGSALIHRRESPVQICLFRDSSGAGKTTFSVNAALESDAFLGLARAASESDIDDCDNFLESIGPQHGLQHLIAIDKPIIYVIDSLDEADSAKRLEVNSLIRFLEDELNPEARSSSLLAFPLVLFFTVREEYWRDWEACFEGYRVSSLINRSSSFSYDELDCALAKYSDAYSFGLRGTLTNEGRRVLSVPFNLHIFAEANEHEPEADLSDVFQENVILNYFSRKADNILKRRFLGFTRSSFLRLCAFLAMECAVERRNMLHRSELSRRITNSSEAFAPMSDDVITALRSEQIIQEDPANPNSFRFRHTRLLEYLVAYHLVAGVAGSGSAASLSALTERVHQAGFLSPFRVLTFVRYIGRTEFVGTSEIIEAHYAGSRSFVKALARSLRHRIALGGEPSWEDIGLIVRNANSSDAQVAWESFFVLAARPSQQSSIVILEAFTLAWRVNAGRSDRWKMFDRLASRGLLLEEEAFGLLLSSDEPKEWEVYLGLVLDLPAQRDAFCLLWRGVHPRIEERIVCRMEPEWSVAHRLLKIIRLGLKYTSGDLA